MCFFGFHPAGGNAPDAGVVEVDLIPPRAGHLSGTRRGQDQEFQRPRRDALLGAQLGHELRNLAIGQGTVMLDRGDLAWARQRLAEVAAPAGRIA